MLEGNRRGELRIADLTLINTGNSADIPLTFLAVEGLSVNREIIGYSDYSFFRLPSHGMVVCKWNGVTNFTDNLRTMSCGWGWGVGQFERGWGGLEIDTPVIKSSPSRDKLFCYSSFNEETLIQM